MTSERSQVFWPEASDGNEPNSPLPRVPAPRADSHARICANCLSLAHVWSVPRAQDVELPVIHEWYGLTMWRCVCHCGCPAVLATTGPAMGVAVK